MVSVVIPTMDRPEHLVRCLRALLGGDEAPREILVVDQSAGDATRQAIAELGAPEVRRLTLDEASTARARNRGLELAANPYVALIDDDGEVGVTWLRDLRIALRELGDPDVLFGTMEAPPGDQPELAVSTHRVSAATIWRSTAHPAEPGFGGHMVVRRSVVLADGGFDARLGPGSRFFASEDIDLTYRLLRSGRSVASSPSVRMIHHQWRTPKALPGHMHGYNVGFGAFCAKHLRLGDRRVLAFLALQMVNDMKMFASAARRRSRLRTRVAAARLAGTFRGLVTGWSAFRPPRR